MFLQKTRRAVCSALALVIGFSAASFSPDSFASITADAAFKQTASEIVEDIGLGWNLGNSLDSYIGTTFGCQDLSSETCWGNPYTTQEMINMVQDSGIDSIRVPVTWYNHMDPNTYKIDDAWMNRVEEVVNYVLSQDMHCILNVHHDTGSNGWLRADQKNLDTNEAIFKSIWEQICARFGKYGDKLLFEGYNEMINYDNNWWNPSDDCLNAANELNQVFVDTVRASGGNNAQRCLVVNTYGGQPHSLVTKGMKVPTDTVSNKIIVEAHVYTPYYFTAEEYPDVTTYNRSELDEVLTNINTTFVQKGYPVIIGEFGLADKKNAEAKYAWAQQVVETATEYGIKCFWWDNGTTAGYKLYNRNTLQVVDQELLNIMLAASKGQKYIADTTLYGDVNNDGVINVSDVELLQEWLLAVPNVTLPNWKAADLCKDEKIDAFDLCAIKRLLLQKNNMCSNVDNWSSWVDTTNGAQAEVSYNGSSVSIDVKNGGSNIWDAQIAYKNITLEKGATYKLSFDYVATAAVSSDCNVMQNHDDYLPYLTVGLDYTTKVQHMESEFTMSDATDKNSEIAFNCGGTSMKPCKITISNLSLVQVSGGSTSTGGSTTQNDGNLCEDATNWTSWVYEEEGASATMTTLDNGIKAEVINGGADLWYVQGSYAGVTLEKGAKYQLEFDYSANQSTSLGVNVQQNYDPYGSYFYNALEYSTTQQHFSETFNMTDATDDNVVIVFNFGGKEIPSGFTATVTNLSLVKVS